LMMVMVRCSSCGSENVEGAVYCTNCGARLQVGAAPTGVTVPVGGRSSERSSWERPRRHRREEADFLGAVTAGVILIILAMAYLRYPGLISAFDAYLRRLAIARAFVKPPRILIEPLVFFFEAVALWTFILAALRVVLQRSIRRAFGDAVGAFFSLFVAFLLTNYADDVYTGRVVLAYFFIGVGLVVVVNALASFAFPEKR